ncbi:Uncharacterised protein [Mycobacteroides abscessus subsp. abscessus]|nr:Uncharacterised protein [Mycobacteroides abscessus subsp. abscessus]
MGGQPLREKVPQRRRHGFLGITEGIIGARGIVEHDVPGERCRHRSPDSDDDGRFDRRMSRQGRLDLTQFYS